jgi:hypothetical protein
MQFGSFTGVKPASRNSFRLGPYYLFVSTRGTAVCLGNLWQVKVRTQDCFAVWTFELLSDLPPVSPNWKSPQISSWSWELAVYDKYNDWLVTTAVQPVRSYIPSRWNSFSVPAELRSFFGNGGC